MVNTEKIAQDLRYVNFFIEQEQIGKACKELRKISDGIQSIWQQTENSPNLHEYRPKYYTELEDIEEKETIQQSGLNLTKKIDLNAVIADIEKICQDLDQNNLTKAIALLDELCNAFEKKPNDKYNDPGKIGDLILQARSELKKQSQTIISEKFAAEMISTTTAQKLVEKYIDQAYEEGRAEEKALEIAKYKPEKP